LGYVDVSLDVWYFEESLPFRWLNTKCIVTYWVRDVAFVFVILRWLIIHRVNHYHLDDPAPNVLRCLHIWMSHELPIWMSHELHIWMTQHRMYWDVSRYEWVTNSRYEWVTNSTYEWPSTECIVTARLMQNYVTYERDSDREAYTNTHARTHTHIHIHTYSITLWWSYWCSDWLIAISRSRWGDASCGSWNWDNIHIHSLFSSWYWDHIHLHGQLSLPCKMSPSHWVVDSAQETFWWWDFDPVYTLLFDLYH